jgi:hypothetical protein
MGRPTKCTPELIEALSQKIRKGLPIRTSCLLVGIGESTYHEWMGRAEAGEEPFVTFQSSLFVAEAEAEEFWLEVLQSSTCDKSFNPNPAYFWLERRRRKDWGRQIEVEQTTRITADDVLKELGGE